MEKGDLEKSWLGGATGVKKDLLEKPTKEGAVKKGFPKYFQRATIGRSQRPQKTGKKDSSQKVFGGSGVLRKLPCQVRKWRESSQTKKPRAWNCLQLLNFGVIKP